MPEDLFYCDVCKKPLVHDDYEPCYWCGAPICGKCWSTGFMCSRCETELVQLQPEEENNE